MAASSSSAPVEPIFGKVNAFLTQDEHMRFRATSNLLRVTNKLDNVETLGLGMIRPNTNLEGSEIYTCLKEFGHLLIRHLEVVAITAPDPKSKLIQIFGDENQNLLDNEDKGDCGVYFTSNPDPDVDRPKGTGVKKGQCAPLFIDNALPTPDMLTTPGQWLLEKIDCAKSRGIRINASLSLHTSILWSLIKATHITTTEKELATSRATLSGYVMLSSVAKLSGRIKRGKAKYGRNLYAKLIKTARDSEHTKKIPVRGTEDGIAVEGTTLSRDFLKHIHDSFAAWDCLPHELKDMDTSKDLLYNAETRNLVQTVLATLLKQINKLTIQLLIAKEETARARIEFPKDEKMKMKNAQRLDKLSVILSDWLRLLCFLTTNKRALLESHLRYLQDAFQIESTYSSEQRKAHKRSSSSNNMPSEFQDPESSEPTSRPQIPSEEPTQSEGGDDRDVDAITPAMEGTDISSQSETNYQGDFIEIEAWNVQKRWDKAALKYLDLICPHENAILALSKKVVVPEAFDKALNSFLHQSEFQFLRAYQSVGDTNTMSMTEVLQKTKYDGDQTLTKGQITELKSWVHNNVVREDGAPAVAAKTWDDIYKFAGNFHCETLLLSLHLLGQNQAEIIEQNPKGSHPAYLQLPPKSLLDKFSAPLKYLPTSKRCCPACHALVEYYRRNANDKLMYEGHHQNWFSVTLPPWITKAAGRAVIEEAEQKLRNRLQQFVNREEKTSQPSDTGSSPVKKMVSDDTHDFTPGGIEPIDDLTGPLEDSEEEASPRGQKNKRVASENFPLKNLEHRS